MRRLLLAMLLFFLLALAGGSASLYFLRDRIILRELRLQAEQLGPFQVEIGSLHTNILGAVSVELGELEVRQAKDSSVKIRSIEFQSRFGIFALYKAWKTKSELPLNVIVHGLKVTLPVSTAAAKSSASTMKPAQWPQALPIPVMSPFPVQADILVSGGEVSGPTLIKDMNLNIQARARESGMEANLDLNFLAGVGGAEALLPVSLKTKIVASREAVKLQSLSFRAAGLEGGGSGDLSLQPVRGKLALRLDAADLSRVSLRPEDRAALGLSAQPSGSFSLKLETEAGDSGQITTVGILRATELQLPVNAPEHTAFSALAKGHHVEGPVALHAEIPFRLRTNWTEPTPASIFVQNARIGFDLTKTTISSKGILTKASGVPLKGEISVSSSEQGIDMPSLSLTFHTMTLNGNANLPPPLGSSISAGFRLQVTNLAGFPEMLPMLRAAETNGAALSDAQGSVQAEGQIRALPASPGKSMVDLKSLSIRGLRLPLAYSGESASLKGVLTGSANAAGRFNAGDLNVSHTSGSFDLTGLEIALEKFAKKRGKKLVFAFDAKGSPTRLQISKVSVAADGINASLSGSAAFDGRRNATLNLNSTTHAELAPLREYLPKLPIKLTGGVFDAQIKIGGTWMPEGGIEKSPLTLTGKLSGKIASVSMPEPPPAVGGTPPAKTPPPTALLPNWPAARNANFTFHFDLGQFQRGALVASGIAANGILNKGSFQANATVAKIFGARASLKNITGSLLDPLLALRGAGTVDGLDLAQAAAFVDPSYGKIVKGLLKADSTFLVPNLWSDKLMETASATGKAEVHNGYLSTASFDGLINEKLKSIPGVGDKAKVSTGGVAAEIHTAFQVAGGTATLQNFVATTPKKDEMRLGGSMNLAFDCDLSGEAHLANAPVTGPIREANSDPEGRLVVPVHFHGNLKSPQADVATGAIEAMLKKTAAHEAEKMKAKALDAVKEKAKNTLQDAAGGFLDQLKKNLKK